jgi:hypothetical protein
MDAAEAEDLCDRLTELAGKGPCKDAQALVQARTILRRITQTPQATAYLRERATDVDRALSGWFDAEEKHHALLKGYSNDIYTLIDQMHSALREALRFTKR